MAKKGTQRFQVGFPQAYVREELQKPLTVTYEVIEIFAADRVDAARKVWEKHGERWRALMKTCPATRGFVVSLYSGLKRKRSASSLYWRLSPITVARGVFPSQEVTNGL
jgi:hypothetical protein